ncbi:Protein tesmin/TSO1-like CXC 2 [Olea europaea subsp. europaea]|uniref:Protein tesmin/TSO1-like CXC 2 n=1 Tax=Olea europaea subsp. europaea TaxID=158383 RepID=A0A8S0VDJ2_OLEEU|nr:Protein tesmin/TSO1-like CXC 2 [Olea europaea subsp. europaea]
MWNGVFGVGLMVVVAVGSVAVVVVGRRELVSLLLVLGDGFGQWFWVGWGGVGFHLLQEQF